LPRFFEQYLASFKLTISDKKGKSQSKEVKDKEASPLIGLHIGNEVDASIVGLAGKMKITGGSDKSGIPMRGDIYGSARKQTLLSKGTGLKNVEKGIRRRRLIRGNTISEEIYQINCSYDGELKVEEAPKEEEQKA